VRVIGIAALTATVVAGLTVIADQPQAVASPDSVVATSPAPGDRFAAPQSNISFRGITPAALGAVRVTGSRSGVHAGSLVGDPAGAAVWQPRAPFTPGERVTVQTGVAIAGATGDEFSFDVARIAADAPEVLPPASGTGPKAAVDASADPSASASPQVVATCTPSLMSFHSEPGLTPPGACVNQPASGSAPGYLFVAPKGGSRGDGAAIFDDDGNLVWYDPVKAPFVHNLEPVTYHGQPMLAFYQGSGAGGHGSGEYVLMDEHYQVVSYIRAGNGYQADLHDLTITPQDTALVGSYVPVRMDLRPYGGTASQAVYDYAVQEIDVATGRVLFTWHSLDHVPVTESDYAVPSDGSGFDYFHGNSIQLGSDGNVLISGRNVSAVYKINRFTGAVMWQLGGKHSSFTLQPSGEQWFCYQHDAHEPAANLVTVFDDGNGGPSPSPSPCPSHSSRGLTLTLNPANHTATITRDLQHDPALNAFIVGSNQTLANGDALVSWGNAPEITEFSAADQPNFDMSLSGFTYRTYRTAWTGVPNYPPAIASSRATGSAVTVYMSWNGSTGVASWQVLAGSSASSLQPVGPVVPKTGFETQTTVDTTDALVAVQARDASGNVLATSPAVPTDYTPPRGGYYLGTRVGNVYNYGAPWYGSMAGKPLPAPVVGIATDPNTGGYWLVTSKGNVYNYNAPWYGSMAGTPLPAPVVGIAADPKTGGYWLVTSKGNVYNYNAPWYGSMAGKPLPAPVVGIAADPNGAGYLLVTTKGNVYNFHTPWYGSPAASVVHLSSQVVGIATHQGAGAQRPSGYYVACANGDVYNYGIPLPGSPVGLPLPAAINTVGAH
jgi:Arylsulfotransferase (ASST)